MRRERALTRYCVLGMAMMSLGSACYTGGQNPYATPTSPRGPDEHWVLRWHPETGRWGVGVSTFLATATAAAEAQCGASCEEGTVHTWRSGTDPIHVAAARTTTAVGPAGTERYYWGSAESYQSATIAQFDALATCRAAGKAAAQREIVNLRTLPQ